MVSLWDVLMAVPCNPRQLIASSLVTCHVRHVLVTSLMKSTCILYLFPISVLMAVRSTLVQQPFTSPKMDKSFYWEQMIPRVTSTWSRCATMKSHPRHPKMVLQTTAVNDYDPTRTTHQLAFLHSSAGYSARTTFLRAIRCNYFLGWPHPTHPRAAQLLQKSVHTANGHMHMIQKHICSSTLPPDNASADPPAPHTLVSRTWHVAVEIINTMSDKEFQNLIATDLPGRYQ